MELARTDTLSWEAILAAVDVLLFFGMVIVSAATASTIGGATDDAERRTLAGFQGGGLGWHKYGRIYLLDGRTSTWSEER